MFEEGAVVAGEVVEVLADSVWFEGSGCGGDCFGVAEECECECAFLWLFDFEWCCCGGFEFCVAEFFCGFACDASDSGECVEEVWSCVAFEGDEFAEAEDVVS